MQVADLSQTERFFANGRVDGGDRGETAASTRVAPRGYPTLPWARKYATRPCGCTCGGFGVDPAVGSG